LWSKKSMAAGSAQCRPISLATVAGCISSSIVISA
jgi:hypothetical protein